MVSSYCSTCYSRAPGVSLSFNPSGISALAYRFSVIFGSPLATGPTSYANGSFRSMDCRDTRRALKGSSTMEQPQSRRINRLVREHPLRNCGQSLPRQKRQQHNRRWPPKKYRGGGHSTPLFLPPSHHVDLPSRPTATSNRGGTSKTTKIFFLKSLRNVTWGFQKF